MVVDEGELMKVKREYDLVILGGGTGGYVAAIRASQLGLDVAVVEKDKLGGTCLHQGCIPSKSLLKSAEVFEQTKMADLFGIEINDATVNFSKVQERKENIIQSLYQGVQTLMKKGKIDIIEGTGRILGPSIFSPLPGTISVEHPNQDENTMLVPKNVIIATGSKPKTLQDLDIDGKFVLTSDEALQLKKLPKSILIIGGGVIGIEWASMLADFGVEVTVVEFLDEILPTEDEAVQKEVRRLLQKRNITFITNTKVLPDTLKKDDHVSIDVKIGEEVKTLTSEKILLSIGREANVNDIGLSNTDIQIENEVIQTNEFYQTKETHIYAIGDVIGGMQLAHVASREGIIAVEHMVDENPLPLIYNHVPTCIYSQPEVASVGLTEKEAKKHGFILKVGKFPFKAIGKALVEGKTDGFVKVIADKETEDLLGVHIVGPDATNLISEAGLAKVLDATPWEIAQSIHPHPSLSEIIGEAALAVEGSQIHG